MTLTVRRATVDDAAAFARSMGDPRVYANLMQQPYPNEAIWRSRLADLQAPGKADLLLVAEREIDGRREVVGSAGLHPLSLLPRQGHVAMVGISVLPEAWRQGVGTVLMQALCDVADRWMQVRRMHLDVYTDNAAAIALYRKFGFVVESTARAYAMRDGTYVDSYGMGRLHPNPPAIPVQATPVPLASAPPGVKKGTASGGWTIRRAESADLDAVAALAVRRGVVEGLPFAPLSAVAAVRERLAESPADCALVALAEDRVIGYASLAVHANLRRRHAATFNAFVAPEWQRRGVGSALAAALLDWADGWAGLLRIELDVQQGNDAALAFARRHGFEPEGVLRAALLRDGAYVDVNLLARLHPRPPRWPEPS